MKLRNKKTGEIGRLLPYGGEDGKIWVWIDNMSRPEYRYNSLAELNAEWEDCEEPKTHWMIDTSILEPVREIAGQPYEIDREIGNWFNSKEEAELAVRKLKAWKRLKDKGIKIIDYECCGGVNKKGEFLGEVKVTIDVPQDVDKYLFETLFGGEE